MKIELTFGRCEKWKKSRASSRIFIPEGRTSGSSIQNGFLKNFEIMLFGNLTKNVASNFQDLWMSCLASEKSHGDSATQRPSDPATQRPSDPATQRPSDPSSSHSKNNQFWIPAVSLAQHWLAEKRKVPCFWVRCPKKLYFETFGRAILDCGIQTSLCNDINPGKKYMIGFESFQPSKVSSHITVPMEKYEKRLSPCYVRVPTSGTTPSKKRRVAAIVHVTTIPRTAVCSCPETRVTTSMSCIVLEFATVYMVVRVSPLVRFIGYRVVPGRSVWIFSGFYRVPSTKESNTSINSAAQVSKGSLTNHRRWRLLIICSDLTNQPHPDTLHYQQTQKHCVSFSVCFSFPK